MGEPGRPADLHGAATAPLRRRHDPLAHLRAGGDPAVDVFVSGTVFLDIVFTGLVGPPACGTEVWTEGMGSSPGGVANLAISCARLGLHTALAAAFGHDLYGDFCWQTLQTQEGVDLSCSQRFAGWHSPVTVSLAYERDRAMVTHGHAAPIDADILIGHPPPSRACVVDLGVAVPAWVGTARDDGALLFAGTGWDPDGRWDSGRLRDRLAGCHAFVPNAVEAMSYTRTDSPEEALDELAGWVDLAVVTCGPAGALGSDATTGERAWAPALPVDALDPTGAGDVFLAGLLVGTLAGWPLVQRLRFANLCAALSVRHFGGSLSAPGWGDLAQWWALARDAGGPVVEDYAFLAGLLPVHAAPEVARATATIGFRSL